MEDCHFTPIQYLEKKRLLKTKLRMQANLFLKFTALQLDDHAGDSLLNVNVKFLS